jgi:nicotinamidase-related amidase
MADSLRIDPSRAGLLLVDIQERLHSAMAEESRKTVERYVPVLVEMARRFEMPVVVSEQYPKGLGPTIPPVEQSLTELGDGLHRFEKIEFSVCATDAFTKIREKTGCDQWIVAGMEAHVCVYQSVRGLINRGAAVHVARDAVASRTVSNRDVGLGLIERAGGVVTSTEVVVFDVLREAGGGDFKALSRLIR